MAKWDIEGKNVLITGGASGLGAAYVEIFLKEGAKKIAILDIAETIGNQFAKKLNQTYKDKVIFIKCDVGKEDDVEKAFDQVVTLFKRIDVIINNAGIMNDAPDVWKTANNVNWNGTVSFAMKGIQHMRRDEGGQGGTIINVSSVAAFFKISILPIYCGSKSAVLHFGRSISSPEFISDSGVRILTICFGATDTPLLHELERKSFDIRTSAVLLADTPPISGQKVESAANAFVKMYNEGTPGSIWLSTDDKPAKDITSEIDTAYQQIINLMLPDGVLHADELTGIHH